MAISRRSVLAGVGAGVAATLVPARLAAGVAAPTAPGPPVARVAPVATDYFGQRIIDPYRWMEDPKDPEWAPWLKGQADHAADLLGHLPGRADMTAAIDRYAAQVEQAGYIIPAGDMLFVVRRPKGARTYQTFARPIAGGPERLVIDPAAIKVADSRALAMADASPSPDGRYFAAKLIPDGSEDDAAIYVVDAVTGRLVGDPVTGARFGGVSWLPDASGFFYNRQSNKFPRGDVHFYDDSVVMLHLLEGDSPERVMLKSGDVAGLAYDAAVIPYIIAGAGCDWVLGSFVTNEPYDGPFFLARLRDVLAGAPQWRMVSRTEDHVEAVALAGDRFYMRSRGTAPRFEVRMASFDRPAFADARIVVPESDVIVEAMTPTSEGLWVRGRKGGVGHLRFLGKSGTLTTVDLPPEGSLWGVSGQPVRPETWVALDDYTLFGRYYQLAGHGKPATPITVAAPFPHDLGRYHVERVSVRARDGTMVPIDLVKLKSLKPDGRNPALIYAYGAYGINIEAEFQPPYLPFLDAGGIYAVAHVRGGGEFGEAWHAAGQKATKANTWRDAIDCGEWLIASGWSGKGRLALWGTSAGGIMVGRAITERPDLWAAAVDEVGVGDMLRFENTQNGPSNIGEFGTVTKADEFGWLLAMSPYHSVRDGTRYPAILLLTGANDPRVEPWQVAKMAARLQAATTSGKPVILRVDYEAGHGVGSSAGQRNRKLGDVFAFVLAHCRGSTG